MLVANEITKVCSGCKRILSVTEFTKLSESKDGLRERCKCCCKIYNAEYFSKLPQNEKDRRYIRDKQWKKENKHKLKASWQKSNWKRYGLKPEDYTALLEKQAHVCAICKKPESYMFNGALLPLAVDHNHETGKVRGLLCGKCNRALGGFNDNVDLLNKAIEYLQNTEVL